MNLVITAAWGERLGGAETFLWTFLRHVDRQRVEPTVVFLRPGPFEREVAALGFETLVIPTRRLRNVGSLLRAVGKTAQLLRLKRPDLVLNWSAKTHVYGALAAELAGMSDRVVWWQHCIADGGWLDRLATALPTRAVGCCSLAARLAQQRYWPRRRTFLVYPGVDAPSRSSVGDLLALKQGLGIPNGRSVVGTVGRLQPGKGQEQFIHAIAALQQRGRDVHGLIVGGNAHNLSPGYVERLEQLANTIGVSNRITFTGQVAAAGPYIQLMDILVSASRSESFGIVLLEAMALGVPVASFDAGGPAEIVEDGRSGVLVPAGDAPSLVEAMDRLVVDSLLRRRLAVRGLERFHAFFSGESMSRRMEQCLSELCPN